MTVCTSTYTDSYARLSGAEPIALPCFKQVDDQGRHRGDHQTFQVIPFKAGDKTSDFRFMREDRQAFVRLVSFSEGGSESRSYDPKVPNTNCMCRNNPRLGHAPEDHHWTTCSDCGSIIDSTKQFGLSLCFACSHWKRRVDEVKAGAQYLRPHEGMSADRIYTFSASNPGGFGGARFTIILDDGTVVANDQAGLWDGGSIPWWVDEDLPPNCTIESGSGKTKVPGHTDRFGTPLTFTDGPEPTS